jgi:anti-anti-sigma factor
MGLPLNITVQSSGPLIRLVVDGEVDMSSAPELLAAVEAAVDADVDVIEIDLSDVWFLDSAGIDALVQAQRRLNAHTARIGHECQLRVVRPSTPAAQVLRAAGVHGYLQVVEPGRAAGPVGTAV